MHSTFFLSLCCVCGKNRFTWTPRPDAIMPPEPTIHKFFVSVCSSKKENTHFWSSKWRSTYLPPVVVWPLIWQQLLWILTWFNSFEINSKQLSRVTLSAFIYDDLSILTHFPIHFIHKTINCSIWTTCSSIIWNHWSVKHSYRTQK